MVAQFNFWEHINRILFAVCHQTDSDWFQKSYCFVSSYLMVVSAVHCDIVPMRHLEYATAICFKFYTRYITNILQNEITQCCTFSFATCKLRDFVRERLVFNYFKKKHFSNSIYPNLITSIAQHCPKNISFHIMRCKYWNAFTV